MASLLNKMRKQSRYLLHLPVEVEARMKGYGPESSFPGIAGPRKDCLL